MAQKEIQEFFEKQAADWDYSFDEKKLNHLRWIFRNRIVSLEGPVLDLGCGTGVLLNVLPEILTDSHSLILELDISMAMLRGVGEKMSGITRKVWRVQGDGHRLPLADRSLNSVVAFQVFPHFLDSRCVLKEVYRTLKENGRFVILHLMNHQQLNALHHSADKAIEDHYLPPMEELADMLKAENFRIETGMEEEDCYLITGRK